MKKLEKPIALAILIGSVIFLIYAIFLKDRDFRSEEEKSQDRIERAANRSRKAAIESARASREFYEESIKEIENNFK